MISPISESGVQLKISMKIVLDISVYIFVKYDIDFKDIDSVLIKSPQFI